MTRSHHLFSAGRGLGGFAIFAVLAACSSVPGTAETDRIATVVADAISFPHLDTADGFVRAALATDAGMDSRLTVVEVQELHADELVDPLARLVFQVHLAASGTGLSSSDPVTACYEAQFSYYGVIGHPRRVGCPEGAAAIVPDPLAPQARVVIPAGFDTTLAELLAVVPATPTAAEVATLVTSGLPAPVVDPNTGVQDLSPTVEAAVDGADVGVSLREHNRRCLLGARIDGQVMVWRLTRVQSEPGELSCDPQTALQQAGTR